ncbi:MAG: hypothetical protein JWP31_1342 [Aeromicrobium sp.]|nr:hypothetical protein [Aeromicrobium sp.]
MPTSRWTLLAVPLLAVPFLVLAGCSSDRPDAPRPPTVTAFRADDITCDHDKASAKAESINERVGGLRADAYTVRFSQSTRAGVVSLVTGDTTAAFKELTGTYGVAIVAAFDAPEDDRAVTGFEQVQRLVDAACDPDER